MMCKFDMGPIFQFLSTQPGEVSIFVSQNLSLMARPGAKQQDEVPKAALNKENWREALVIFSYLKPYRFTFLMGLIVIGLSSMTTLAFPYFLKVLIDSADAIRKGEASLEPGTIALGMVGILLVQGVLSFLRA